MNDFRFTLHRRVWQVLPQFTPEEQEALRKAIEPLVDLPPERWAEAGAKKLAAEGNVFLVRVDDNLRAFVQPTPGGPPEVEDIVERDRLEFFAQLAGSDGRP
jgi:hypothetical protein